jgi:hypothetical protein
LELIAHNKLNQSRITVTNTLLFSAYASAAYSADKGIITWSYCFCCFEGAHCETNIDDCQLNQCENNGTCVDGLGDYYCNCQAGFEGKKILVSSC